MTLNDSLANLEKNRCGLRSLLSSPGLSSGWQRLIATALEQGWTLCRGLPSIDPSLQNDWIGERLFLIHQSQLTAQPNWSGIVSSRLNRTDPDFNLWPRWIEQVVRHLVRDKKTLLSVPGTAVDKILKPLAAQSSLLCLTIRPSGKVDTSLDVWFANSMRNANLCASAYRDECWVSPALTMPTSDLEHFPLADRLNFVLPHSLVVLSMRPKGNMASLTKRRLEDRRFPAGTFSLRLTLDASTAATQWVYPQAVGWFIPDQHRLRVFDDAAHCKHGGPRATFAPNEAGLVSWTAAARLLGSASEYLVHCVRGLDAEAFCRGETESVLDAIVHGALPDRTALRTLWKIIAEGRLRASDKLLRSGRAAVSFSAVPLSSLLERRRYQAHLSRWDWEPYGLMIRRDVLESLGARPVIYGDEQLFQGLSPAERVFYQPAVRRRSQHHEHDWQAEQEWRLPEDVRLGELPPNSLLLFVRTAAEAQALASRVGWPVIWQQANQNGQPPDAARRRRRSSFRTSKN